MIKWPQYHDETPNDDKGHPRFIAGYKAANEWISVEDELPENEIYINLKLKNGDFACIFYETRSDLIMLKRDCTHWKPIN